MNARTMAEGYAAGCKKLAALLQLALEAGLRPAFRMPPEDVVVIGVIAQVPLAAVNDDARAFYVTVAARMAGDEEPTLEMLRWALKYCNVPYIIVPLDQLGIRWRQTGAPS